MSGKRTKTLRREYRQMPYREKLAMEMGLQPTGGRVGDRRAWRRFKRAHQERRSTA